MTVERARRPSSASRTPRHDLSDDPGRHPADEAGGHAAPVVAAEGRRAVHGRRSLPRHPAARSPIPTRRSRVGSRPASRSTRPRRATGRSSSTSRWGRRAGSRRTTTRPTRRRSTRSSPCPTPRRRSVSVSSSSRTDNGDGTTHLALAVRTIRPRRTSRRRRSATSPTREESMVETSTGRTLPVYNAIDSTATRCHSSPRSTPSWREPRPRSTSSATSSARTRSTPPVRSPTGRPASATRSRCRPSRTTPAGSRAATRRSTSAPSSTSRPPVGRQQRHAGDVERHLVQRGLGELGGVVLAVHENGGDEPGRRSSTSSTPRRPTRTGRSRPPSSTAIPPTSSSFFPTYDRGAMTVQGYREIVGDDVFFAFVQAIQRQFAPRQHLHGRVHRRRRCDARGCTATAQPAGRLLPAVALRRDQADDPAGSVRLTPRRRVSLIRRRSWRQRTMCQMRPTR